MSEEAIMIKQNEINEYLDDDLTAYKSIPYFLFDDNVIKGQGYKNLEFNEIQRYYRIYKKGASFIPEGSNHDYIPSDLKYKKASMIINKEARFLFSNPPTFNVNEDDVDGTFREENAIIQDFLDKVLEKNNFEGKILKALKDCFIGKRVAVVVNFNEKTGISITFLNSLEFVYETSGRENDLTKFVAFYKINENDGLNEQRWFRKLYEKNNDGVFITEEIFDGTGLKVKTVTKKTKIKFDIIPAAIILNDGLTGELNGESELGCLVDYEKYYSKLANADMDAERKSMNPIRYTIDASEKSTSSLSSSPGSYWDLQSDDSKANENINARVGTLEAQMNYSTPLKVTLDRLENEMYAELDVPNITSEQLAGVITSGKTIQALYWGLTVRCDEKMLAWKSSLRVMAELIIEGGKLYPKCIKKYTESKSIPEIKYDIVIENNYPIPEDVMEEKTMDISEVESKLMSKKAYIKKWRGLNDSEADKELQQIKIEQELLENSIITYSLNDKAQSGEQEENFDDDLNDNSDLNNQNKSSEEVNNEQ